MNLDLTIEPYTEQVIRELKYLKNYLSITETRTCEYEVQVLTAALCRSPLYSQKIDTDTFGIPCEKIGDKTPVGECGYFLVLWGTLFSDVAYSLLIFDL